MICHFAHLKESDLKSLLPDLTLVIFPVGGLEQHGSHLPLGTKLIQSREWVKSLAQKLQVQFADWNFVIMPELPFTVDTYTSAMALTVRPHVVRDALVDQCESLKKMGFTQFAALSTHLTPKQLCAIEDASKIVSKGKKFSFISLSSGLIDVASVYKSPLIALPEEHAGAFDTGQLLAVHPELVSPEVRGLISVPSPKASIDRFFSYYGGKLDGYWGEPSLADSTHAKLKLERDLDLLVEKLKPVLLKGKGKSVFFSGYRYFPFNGSFFKAYLLAVIFFITVFLWFMSGVKDVFE